MADTNPPPYVPSLQTIPTDSVWVYLEPKNADPGFTFNQFFCEKSYNLSHDLNDYDVYDESSFSIYKKRNIVQIRCQLYQGKVMQNIQVSWPRVRKGEWVPASEYFQRMHDWIYDSDLAVVWY